MGTELNETLFYDETFLSEPVFIVVRWTWSRKVYSWEVSIQQNLDGCELNILFGKNAIDNLEIKAVSLIRVDVSPKEYIT